MSMNTPQDSSVEQYVEEFEHKFRDIKNWTFYHVPEHINANADLTEQKDWLRTTLTKAQDEVRKERDTLLQSILDEVEGKKEPNDEQYSDVREFNAALDLAAGIIKKKMQ